MAQARTLPLITLALQAIRSKAEHASKLPQASASSAQAKAGQHFRYVEVGSFGLDAESSDLMLGLGC